MPPSHLLTPDCVGTGDTCFLCFAGCWKSGHPHPRPSPEDLTQSALSFQVLQRPTGRPSWGESMAGPDAGSDCPPSSLPSPCLSFLTCEMRGHCLLSRLAARPGGQGAGIWGSQGGDHAEPASAWGHQIAWRPQQKATGVLQVSTVSWPQGWSGQRWAHHVPCNGEGVPLSEKTQKTLSREMLSSLSQSWPQTTELIF